MVRLHLRVHGLHHHDGVVHHDADGQHQGEERDQVDRQAEQLHHEEGADERHRDREDGDERAAPVAQEQEDHERHQDERIPQGVQHLFDGRVQEGAHVIAHLVVHPGGHELGLLPQLLLHLGDHIAGVAAQGLLQHDGGRGPAVEVGVDVEELAAELHVGHIAQADQLALLIGPDDDVTVLLGLVELALVHQHVLQRLRVDARALPQAAGTGDEALLLHGLHHLLRTDGVGAHPVRLEPHAHGVLAAAQDLGLGDTGDALDLRDQLRERIVVQEELVRVLPVAVEVHVHEHAGLHRRDDHPFALHQQGQVGHHLVHARLHADHRHVRVGARFEDDADGGFTGTGGVRGDVPHALHTVDRRFQLHHA